ncbi:uncharacterized protein LOC118186822 [Stegodyphus dumicola]|uniref:uncharacterized protein LOC118186822 n=1 Tax=Stegodyphus dumicola TaxID=202533 RepID=UPI0015AB0258|nr:uncharacterized protein LOC118186822 [Stegodyphus dumicola]
MYISSKLFFAVQVACCLSIIGLIGHAGFFDRDYFGASPSATCLLLVACSHLVLCTFILLTAITTSKIYETPLICVHDLLFFTLLVATGTASIWECKSFESKEEKEIGTAGAIAIFTAFVSMIGCCTSYKVCENMKSF